MTKPLETLRFEKHGGVASITLNRPEHANTLNRAMLRELQQVGLDCERDREVWAVLITAETRMFCAGGDLKEFDSQGDKLPGFLTERATYLHSAITRFQRMSAPVVIAVNGIAAGGGLSLVASGDYVIASSEANFVCAYIASGITPDGGSTYFLAKHIGLLRAKELILTNRRLSAQEALEWGLVNQVVPAPSLYEVAMERARRFAEGPTLAYGAAKNLLLKSFGTSLETLMEDEASAISAMARTSDGRRGITSFAGGSKPLPFDGQ